MINMKQQFGHLLYKNTACIMSVPKVLLMIPIAVLLFVSVVFLYSSILMLKRTPEKLYAERAAQPDFCPFDDIPEKLKEYTVLIEDPWFYEHRGYSWTAIKKAANVNFHRKEIVKGGSTITQQLAKNMYFHFERSYLRKAAELVIAVAMERRLGKRKILELYLNIIYFGNGIYGISDAARFYFDKTVPELSANQMFMLASIIFAPTAANPMQHPEVFERRRNSMIEYCKTKNMDPHDAETILSYHAELLDPQLRKTGSFTDNFSQVPVMINERFGPFISNAHRNNSDGHKS